MPSTKLDLSENGILANLPPAEQESLLAHLTPVYLSPQQVLFEEGLPAKYSFFPKDALIATIVTTQDGGHMEANLIGFEGMLGLFRLLGGRNAPHTAIVESPGACLRIDAETIRSEFLRGRGCLHSRLLSYTAYRLVQTEQAAVCNRVHRLDQRFCRWLLMVRDRIKTDEFPMTHDFLSQLLGVSRPEITIAAGDLRDAGLIHYRRGMIRIENRKGLEAAACECYRIIHAHFTDLLRGTFGQSPAFIRPNGMS